MRGYRGRSGKQMHYSPNLLSTIQNAMGANSVVELEYESRESGFTQRQIEPMGIVYKMRRRNLVGWCRLREAYRSFRLDRIVLIKVMSDKFEPRDDFRIEDFQDDENMEREDYREEKETEDEDF